MRGHTLLVGASGRESRLGAAGNGSGCVYLCRESPVLCGVLCSQRPLLERQRSFRKHSGVRAAFHRDFIKTQLLDIEWGKFYDRLFEDRQEGDYMALTSFDLEYIEAQLSRCAEFLKNLRPLIASLSQVQGL